MAASHRLSKVIQILKCFLPSLSSADVQWHSEDRQSMFYASLSDSSIEESTKWQFTFISSTLFKCVCIGRPPCKQSGDISAFFIIPLFCRYLCVFFILLFHYLFSLDIERLKQGKRAG